MAIKILRLGNSIFPLEITCQSCGALVEIEKAMDLVSFDGCGEDDSAGGRLSISCPSCDKNVYLQEADQEQAKAEIAEWYRKNRPVPG